MKKLCRSTTNRWIAGVCGGIGEYFNIDPVIIRIIWIIFTLTSFKFWFLGGWGVIIYIIMWIIIPEK